MGVSFAGGLALSAAARESVRDRVGYVFSFGGHGDLERTLRYLITGDQPGGKLTPHVYGQAVVVRFFADRLVPADQVEPLREALFAYLKDDKAAARKAREDLGPRAAEIVGMCLGRDQAGLADILSGMEADLTMDEELSPVRGPRPEGPVFLLHGAVDNVIPPSETVTTGRWAAADGPAYVLVSELIKHVDLGDEAEEPSLRDYWLFLRFWTRLLAA